MRLLLVTVTFAAVLLVARADLEHTLQHILRQDYFHKLPSADQVILVELAAEGQVGRLGQYIHKVGADHIRAVVQKLPAHEAQTIEHYIQQHLHHGHPHHNTTAAPATSAA